MGYDGRPDLCRTGVDRCLRRVPSEVQKFERAGGRGAKLRYKNVKRIFRGPWLWIVVAVVGVLLALQYLAPNGGYQQIDTSQMVSYIKDGKVEKITFVDGDQEIRATLDNGQQVMSSWVTGQQVGLVDQVEKEVSSGQIENYNVDVPKPSR